MGSAGSHQSGRLRRSARPFRGSRHGPFGSKIFTSERTGCYGPLPVLAPARSERRYQTANATGRARIWVNKAARTARPWEKVDRSEQQAAKIQPNQGFVLVLSGIWESNQIRD